MLVRVLQRRAVRLADSWTPENRYECEEREFVKVRDAQSETFVPLRDASDEMENRLQSDV
jgi:hypothetical protein